jgi:hypothetical protein
LGAGFENILFDINDITAWYCHGVDLQLIPSDTEDKHIDILYKTLPSLKLPWLSWDRKVIRSFRTDSNIYLTYIFPKFTYSFYKETKAKMNRSLKPFIDSFSSTEETAIY